MSHYHHLPPFFPPMKTTNPTFTDKVRVLHIIPQKCTTYGNPMRLYIFQRINTPDQTQNLDTFHAKNEPNSYQLINLKQGDEVILSYRRRGKSWDFVATKATPTI